MTIELSDAAKLLSDLVSIDSVNPSLVPGAAGEGEIAEYVSAYLTHLHLQVEAQEVAPGRPNVIGTLPGSGGGRRLMLNAHMDTVGIGDMQDALKPNVVDDRLYGRGAYDMKGGLAAIMLTVAELASSAPLRGDVVVMAVVDEEHASTGTEAAMRTYTGDAAVVTEPTGLDVCIAHKGFAWFEIETIGRAAHGSRPDLGADAIAAMGRGLAQIDAINERLASQSPHVLLGHGSLHASLIQGGQELSSYPARCIAHLERRTIPGEGPAELEIDLDQIAAAATHDDRISCNRSVIFSRDAFSVEMDNFLVDAILRSCLLVSGNQPSVVGQTPWMDSALIQSAGVPTVVFGPGGEGAHAAIEWVSLPDVVQCAKTLVHLARWVCG